PYPSSRVDARARRRPARGAGLGLAGVRGMPTPANVLVVNAGSSRLKVRLLDHRDEVLDSLDLDQWRGGDVVGELERFVRETSDVDAVGHRIVHGGRKFREPVRFYPGVRDELEALTELAPLHQPRGVGGIDALTALLPETPAVACFDTA